MNGVTVFAEVMTVVVMSTAAFIAIGLGTRILWRWGTPRRPTAGAPHDDERMQRLETAVDTIAIEVERISEAQRFMVGLLSEAAPARRLERAGELGSPESAGSVNAPR